jgi:hypothetical protein
VVGLLCIIGFVILTPSARCVDWVSGPFCEIDVNGDGQPDLAMKGRRLSGEKLLVLDGRSGAVHWSASALSTSSEEQVFCAGPAAVLTQHADLHIELFGSNGRRIASLGVADEVKSVRNAAGCVNIELGDGTSLAIDLASGQTGGTCAGVHPSARDEWDATRTFEQGGVSIGDLHVLNAPQGGSVVRVALRADRAGQVLWTRSTDIVSNGAHLAPTRNGVLVAGKMPDGHLRLAWVRAADGEVVYEHGLPEGDDLNDVFALMVDSADMAYVDVNSNLYAYDVQSGNARWHTGMF